MSKQNKLTVIAVIIIIFAIFIFFGFENHRKKARPRNGNLRGRAG